MTSMTELRRAIVPGPVYEAHYEGGDVVRMSFFADSKKGIDPESGRRFCNITYAGTVWERNNRATLDRAFTSRDGHPKRSDYNSWDEYERGVDKWENRFKGACIKARELQDKLNAERVEFVKSYQPKFKAGYVEHPSFGRKEHSEFVVKEKTNKPTAKMLRLKMLAALEAVDGIFDPYDSGLADNVAHALAVQTLLHEAIKEARAA